MGCESGHYLDARNETHGTCRRCPVDSTTPPGQNAFDRLHCVCDPGHTPVTESNAQSSYSTNGQSIGPGGRSILTMNADVVLEVGVEVTVDWSSTGGHPFGLSTVVFNEGSILTPDATIASQNIDYGAEKTKITLHTTDTPLYYLCNYAGHGFEGVAIQFATVTSACADCGAGLYKPLLGNQTCTQCPAEAHTNGTGKTDIEDCLCNPGFTLDVAEFTEVCAPCAPGTFKGDIGDEACDICPQDHFCPGNTVVPTACPGNSVSVEGSDDLSDCACVPGFFANREPTLRCESCGVGTYNELYNQSECTNCPVNTFNPDTTSNNVSLCRACDPNAASVEGSSAVTDCLCNLGYAGVPGADCVACEPGFFRETPHVYICEACPVDYYNELDASNSAGHCLKCPANTSSQAGSGRTIDCVCDAGHFHEALQPEDVFYECIACRAGTFQTNANSSECRECPAGTESSAVGATRDVCTQCLPGWYSLYSGSEACLSCPASTYQNTSVDSVTALPCSRCPLNSSHALSAQTDVEACRCAPGFRRAGEGTDYYRCEVCAAGFYCPGDGDQESCALNHYSEAGASVCTKCNPLSYGGRITSVSECLCIAGTEGRYDSDCSLCWVGKSQPTNFSGEACALCEVGKFAPVEGSLECLTCPGNSSSSIGSDELTDCECNAGFFGPAGGPCEVCPEGSYCPGLGVREECRQHSHSKKQSDSHHDCKCTPGYVGVESGAACLKCPVDKYCGGDLDINSCSNHSFSRAGSSVIESCICDPGKWRGCIIASNGSAFNELGPCVIDYSLACFDCGANDVCSNSTLEHCPPHSIAPSGTSNPLGCTCIGGYHRIFPV